MIHLQFIISLIVIYKPCAGFEYIKLNPRDLTAEVLSPTSVELTWKPPQVQINGRVFYLVTKNDVRLLKTRYTNATIPSLLPSTTYKLVVYTTINNTRWIVPGLSVNVTTFDSSPNNAFPVCYRFWLSLSAIILSHVMFAT
nr:unnamed protein product [Spirometra erinaceieuropaei]